MIQLNSRLTAELLVSNLSLLSLVSYDSFIVLFVLLFYIVNGCIDIEDRSLYGLYFNKLISISLYISWAIFNSFFFVKDVYW